MRDRTPDARTLLCLALEEVAGQALVVDAQLKIVGGTTGATELLGFPPPLGKSAPEVLCGSHDRRPLAEALARGQSATAEIMRPTPSGERMIQVKSVPLLSCDKLHGHLLLMTPVGDAVQGTTQRYGILTASESMRSLLRIMERVAKSDASVLVRGETGAGKELVARALHEMSPRSKRHFSAINCAALPPELLESELFGHVRGAFTGAVKDHEGLFRGAEGGTVFLDEVAELPLAMQAKLLRVVQDRTVLPVGGKSPIPVDVRLISATHRALRAEVSAGRFRADLMYRLRVIPLYLPPLRERAADIEPLVHHFVASHNHGETKRRIERVSPGAMRALKKHLWPGNIRELENVIQYAFLLGEGPILSESDLPPEVRDPLEADDTWQETTRTLSPEAARIERALERAGGHRERAAQSLGISRSTLWRRMQEHGLE
jgi:transcriptional regulator with PAS, ATPase and Fis domain